VRFPLAVALVLAFVCAGLGEANSGSRLDDPASFGRTGYWRGYPGDRTHYWRRYAYPRPDCTFAIREYQRQWPSQLWPPSMRCFPYPY